MMHWTVSQHAAFDTQFEGGPHGTLQFVSLHALSLRRGLAGRCRPMSAAEGATGRLVYEELYFRIKPQASIQRRCAQKAAVFFNIRERADGFGEGGRGSLKPGLPFWGKLPILSLLNRHASQFVGEDGVTQIRRHTFMESGRQNRKTKTSPKSIRKGGVFLASRN